MWLQHSIGRKWSLFHGAVGDIEGAKNFIEPQSVDLVITDPPYGKKHAHLLYDLAKFTKFVLKEDGICVFFPGDICLVEAIDAFRHENLEYLWAYKVFYPKPPFPQLQYPIRIFVRAKLLLAFSPNTKEACKRFRQIPQNYEDSFFVDVFYSERSEKQYHEWQQSQSVMENIVKHFVRPEMDIIIDPFCGTGTTGVAALKCNCQFIGSDINSQILDIASQRLSLAEKGIFEHSSLEQKNLLEGVY